MDAERARAFMLTLPHVAESLQWGDNVVFWVGDKSIGGKMFAVMDLAGGTHGVISFAAGPERFTELVEQEGLKPAPYLARASWVAAENWSCMRAAEWESQLRNAHAIVFAKLPKRTREQLSSPAGKRAAKKTSRARRSASATR